MKNIIIYLKQKGFVLTDNYLNLWANDYCGVSISKKEISVVDNNGNAHYYKKPSLKWLKKNIKQRKLI